MEEDQDGRVSGPLAALVPAWELLWTDCYVFPPCPDPQLLIFAADAVDQLLILIPGEAWQWQLLCS